MNTQKDTSPEKINKLYRDFLLYLDNTPGNMIPETLIQLETSIKLLVEDEIAYRLQRDEFERTIMQQVTGNKVNISDLLVQLGEKVQEILKKSPEDIDREMGIFVKELVGIILPPGEGNIREGSGKSSVREEKELSESRYGKILEILRENEIYADDIIVYKGQLRTSQMRQVSYRVIQVPRLSKTIFVCDEYGEASFVVDSLVYPEVFLEHTKSDIREKLSATRIIHSLVWETRILEALFGTLEERKVFKTEKTSKKKVDVRKMEEYREEILRQFPTPEDWMNLNRKQRLELKIYGKGLKAIANIFGIVGDLIYNSRDIALFGQKIYGEGHSIIEYELWTDEKWKEEILRQFPSPENWMSLNRKQRLELKIHGKGINAIAAIFGIVGDPIYNSRDLALLGQRIYDEGHSIIEYELWTDEKWKEEILRQFPSPENWMSLNKKQKGELKIHGKGLVKITRIFGVAGDPVGYSRDMALFGQKIYGEGYNILECELWTPTKWKEEILRLFPTVDDWINLNQRQRLELKIHGRGCIAIATIFGVSGNPIYNSGDIALLGQKIYGEGHSILECELWTDEKWKEEILRQCPSPENWMSLNKKQKGELKIHGKGLIAISRIFRISGDPVGYSRDMALLGQKIYGPNPVFDIYLEEDITTGWTREKWKEEILKKYPIPEDWMSLKYEKKCELKIQGKGLRAISTIFGVSLAPPIGVSRDMALLGEEIYGASPVFDRYIQNKE